MNKKQTIIKYALLLIAIILLVACIITLPNTINAYNTYKTESNATPTATAIIKSVALVTSDPSITPTAKDRVLKNGVKGDDVTKLQQKLADLGYYDGEIDGQYGPGTSAAVILFQSQHGLTADGVAGTQTLSLLYSEQAQTFIPTPTPSATPSSLQKGDNGDMVSQLQTRLKELGYYTGAIDGDYGAQTQEAIRLFQSQNDLEVDGVCGVATAAAVYASDAPHVTITPTPDPSTMPLLVNKQYPLSSSYVPSNMVLLRNILPSSLVYVKGSEMQGDSEAVAALATMFAAAKEDGITGWQISSAYRSYAYQQQIFDNKVASYKAEGMSTADATSATRLTVADPGTSEHQTGLAFDITVADTAFIGTKQQIWLSKNCWDYGFIVRYTEDKEDITGFIAECWHIRYVGTVHSIAMYNNNWCLEEYIENMQ